MENNYKFLKPSSSVEKTYQGIHSDLAIDLLRNAAIINPRDGNLAARLQYVAHAGHKASEGSRYTLWIGNHLYDFDANGEILSTNTVPKYDSLRKGV